MCKSDLIKIAIHNRPGSFSDRWIEYCIQQHIKYEIVDCFDSNIMEQLKKYNVLLWNWFHGSYRDVRAAPPVIRAAEKMGLIVFPSSDTSFSFDNKVAQKYQLESIGAPLVPTYVFYDEKTALEWLSNTTFPKVFKLSRGAGALNVRLIENYSQGRLLVKKAFTSGFRNTSGYFRENLGKISSLKRRKKEDWFSKIKRLPSTLSNIYHVNRMMGREIGYVYFQEFIPNLKHDTRVVIIGKRAFAFQRAVRENDFRASGSGLTIVDPEKIDIGFIQIGFEISSKLNLQCAAYDFVRNESGTPYLIEVSYTFPANKQVKDCPGHWDQDLAWHEGRMWPQDAIIENVISEFKDRQGLLLL